MKFNCRIRNISAILLGLILCVTSSAQQKERSLEADWNIGLHLNGTGGEYLPFWSRTAYDGIMPVSASSVLETGGYLKYRSKAGVELSAGANIVGRTFKENPLDGSGSDAIIDRLYASAGWKAFHVDLGMKPREKALGDLSLTGGNILLSGNARNIPGVSLWSDWMYIDKGHFFAIKGNWAHYQLIDNRYADGLMLHNKSVAFKFALGKAVDFEIGMDHWAQWGGVSPAYGPQPDSFKDYISVVFALKGGDGATLSDQLNALGNHLGREYARLSWRANSFTMVLQYDMPFEDGGQIIRAEPMPDGVYTLKFSLNDRKAFVTDLLYEYVCTTWQSGPIHDRAATEYEMTHEYGKYVYWQDPDHHYYGRIVPGGMDDYFNHGEYCSGWTNYGRGIGLPLIIPAYPNEEGVTLGFVSNRLRAHHLAIRGNLLKLPYTFKATYSSNWGRYFNNENSIFKTHPKQLSLALELELKEQVTHIPVSFNLGAYADLGQVYPDCVGLTLRFLYKGKR